MGLISDKDAKQIKEVFANLVDQVKMVFFTSDENCEFCQPTLEMLTEVAGLGDKITLEVVEFAADNPQAQTLGIDKVPATAIIGSKDFGIRFFGIPAGYEFTTLIEDIVAVGGALPEFPPEVQELVAEIDQPVHLQVAVSPTCPYCPAAVRTAHNLAMASDNIRADMLETNEFPELTAKYEIQGVPHTIINEEFSVIGPVNEVDLLNEILIVLGKKREAPRR